MPDYSSTPDDSPIEFDPAKAKAKRALDAEKIRQDFIKSRRLPISGPTSQQPLPESSEDEL